jgi:N-acetylmuramoyl-L-alanine amidase
VDKRKTTEYGFIHHTVTPRMAADHYYEKGGVIETITRLHVARGFSTIGYTYVVTGEGNILPGRDESMVGAHCLNHNYNSIGISCCGSFVKGGDIMVATDPQYTALLDIVTRMVRKYKIPISHILGHRDGQATECPGQIYDLLPAIRNSVSARLLMPESAPVV